mgnify:CR=1 FL=1
MGFEKREVGQKAGTMSDLETQEDMRRLRCLEVKISSSNLFGETFSGSESNEGQCNVSHECGGQTFGLGRAQRKVSPSKTNGANGISYEGWGYVRGKCSSKEHRTSSFSL